MGRSFDGFTVMEARGYHSQFSDNGRGIDVIKAMQAAYTTGDICDHGTVHDEGECVALQITMSHDNIIRNSIVNLAKSWELVGSFT
ncbi:hypothetical protein PanWU01x14_226310 [Parasponia andersonii]|uniref:Uncharacterized protein n=1 Tax=Parasponia andersonii TaxID=3476 RepID=A0A2P5BML2_PARAD|nr:hypothetical protein PanWU01x14_226310 [Parasponia andersonii]